MLHPTTASVEARARYNEFVREADLYRQISRLESKTPNFVTHVAAFVAGLFTEVTAETVPATSGNTAL